jgi:hypothetical protein
VESKIRSMSVSTDEYSFSCVMEVQRICHLHVNFALRLLYFHKLHDDFASAVQLVQQAHDSYNPELNTGSFF